MVAAYGPGLKADRQNDSRPLFVLLCPTRYHGSNILLTRRRCPVGFQLAGVASAASTPPACFLSGEMSDMNCLFPRLGSLCNRPACQLVAWMAVVLGIGVASRHVKAAEASGFE